MANILQTSRLPYISSKIKRHELDAEEENRLHAVTKTGLHRLKGFGYLTSSVSVFVLAVVSWSSAQKSTVLTVLLIMGTATSIIGMFCRWLTYEIEKRKPKS